MEITNIKRQKLMELTSEQLIFLKDAAPILGKQLNEETLERIEAVLKERNKKKILKKECVVKTTLRDNRDNSVSIFVQNLWLDLDSSVEDQIHDYFPMHTVLDFKWSEDLEAFNSATLPLNKDDECSVMEGRRLGKERYFYI